MKPLKPEALCRVFDPEQLDFETTDALEELDEILGQSRAVEAIRFAADIDHEGYNLFIFGPTGAGRHRLAQRLLGTIAASGTVADEWAYVHCFREPNRPRVLWMPAGRGVALKRDMARLVEDLRVSIPAAFDTEEYRARRDAIESAFSARQEGAVAAVKGEATERSVAVLNNPEGIALAPLRDGKLIPAEEMEQLPDDERERIQASLEGIHELLRGQFRQLPRWVSEQQDAIRALDRETTTLAVEHLVEALSARWRELPDVVDYLQQVTEDVIDGTSLVLRQQEGEAPSKGDALIEGSRWRRYAVNLLVDRSHDEGAPVVYEDNPTLPALVGRVEHVSRMGALVTDFTLIRPGALHRANGGFLILDAQRLLARPLAWEQLKRALRSGEIRIEPPGEGLSPVSTVSLEPAAVPLNLKVVLLGEPSLYYTLDAVDPELQLLFKVPAEIEGRVERTPEAVLGYARLIATLGRGDGLLAFDRGAVARVLRRASRLAGDSTMLTTHLDSLTDLLREADFHARRAGREVVTAEDVVGAVEEERRRRGRVQDRSLDEMTRGTIRMETEGAVIGQVNGLTVASVGRSAFGRPARITARVRAGRGQLIDIEREVELGGPLHSKGVLILSGFLGARFGGDVPLALAASLVFEQSYGPIDGDSASLAETVALFSALAELPARQDVAMTGAIDQRGQVQAIGGVNEKIEGFFAICEARGLSGTQGVVIPSANVTHLMLRDEVVAAAAAGRFHVWAVDTVDEVLELITGVEAGGVSERVRARLARFAALQSPAG